MIRHFGIIVFPGMLSVIFYCESNVFGGHEKMAVAAHTAIEKCHDSVRVQWLVSREGSRLIEVLERAGLDYKLLANPHPVSLWRNPLRAARFIRQNAAIMGEIAPDLIVVVQGGVLLSLGGVFSAAMIGRPCISYLPMVAKVSDMKQFRYPRLMDFVADRVYKVISSYITIDGEQAERIRRKNTSASVVVVENYVPPSHSRGAREDARTALGIPAGKKVLTVVGRTEFSHKCQDWTVSELKAGSFLDDKFVLFVGDGSDAAKLEAMLVPEIRDRFGRIGWRDDLSEVYAATDVLLIPSKFEGVPLVMLEALGYGIPVVGSDRDGMRSWLPAQWRFPWGDTDGLKKAIDRALTVPEPDAWAAIELHLNHVQNEERFAAEFAEALKVKCRRRHSRELKQIGKSAL